MQQQYQGAQKALLMSMAATGLLSLTSGAFAAQTCSPNIWSEGKTYTVNTLVSYSGHNYTALTTHTAYVGANWNPAATPTLWKDAGICDVNEVAPTPTPVPTPVITSTPVVTASPTPTPVITASPSPTPVVTASPAPTPIVSLTPNPTPSANTWVSSTAYTAGQRVVYNGHQFEAKWWTQGQAPSTTDQWGPWKDLGVVSSNQAPKINSISPANGSVFYGEVFIPIVLGADVVDTDGSISKVEFILNGKSVGVDTSAPYSISATVGLSNTLQVIATDNQGATTSTTSSFSFKPGTPPPTPSASPSPTPNTTAVIGAVQTTTWKNGAKGAYSLVHDDYCSMYYANDPYIKIIDPELSKRGLVASFGMITSNCSDQHWAAAKDFMSRGHEIVSHSRSHPNPYIPDASLEAEMNGATADMAAKLDGYKPSYFIWPGDVASNKAIEFLKAQPNFIGGRATHLVDGSGPNNAVDYTTMPAGVNPANFDNPYRVKWDLFTADGKWSLYPMGSEILNLHIDAAINQGGWATRTAHGVDTGYWETIPLNRYTKHLDYAKAKVDAGELWMDTPSNVIKYRYARDFCKLILPTVTPFASVAFDTSSAECKKYATPITLQVKAIYQGGGLSAIQNGKALTVTKGANDTYLVTANPLAGAVSFAYFMP